MHCKEFRAFAGAWMEGERPAAAEAHVSECARCQGLLADLEGIRAAAPQFADDVEPPVRVWTAIRAQLDAEGLIRTPVLVPTAEPGWAERLRDFFPALLPRALAGAYLSALLALAALVGVQTENRSEQALAPNGAAPALASVRAELTRAERGTVPAMHYHDPALAQSYRDNLAIVDNFIALCEKSVREEPRNSLAREYLYGAYQQKAELLSTMVDRAATGE